MEGAHIKKLALLIPALLLTAGCGDDNSGIRQQQNNELTRDFRSAPTPAQERRDDPAPVPDVPNRDARTQSEPDFADGREADVRAPHPLSLADLHRRYPSTFILSGSPDKRQIALTFDDAPDAVFTPQVLDVLRRYNVRATFFVVGSRAEAHPDIVRRMVREGHTVGNHSYSHANLPRLADPAFREEIVRTDRVLRNLSGYTPGLLRPSYGNINENQIRWLASQRMLVIGWNVDSLDWKGLSAAQVSTNILAHVHPGSIVLQHAAGGRGENLSGTIRALPRVIESLRADGVRLVTVPELLNLPQR